MSFDNVKYKSISSLISCLAQLRDTEFMRQGASVFFSWLHHKCFLKQFFFGPHFLFSFALQHALTEEEANMEIM